MLCVCGLFVLWFVCVLIELRYLEESLPMEMRNKAASVSTSEAMAAEEKIEALVDSLHTAVYRLLLLCVSCVW